MIRTAALVPVTWPDPIRAVLTFLGNIMRFAYLDPRAGRRREGGGAGTESAFGATHVYTGEYNFATDGGAISTINLTPVGVEIPIGAVILRAKVEVLTVPTSAGAPTIALGIETTTDLLAAVLISATPWSTATPKDLPLASASPSIKTAAARRVTATIAVATLTAGRFRVHVEYLDTRA